MCFCFLFFFKRTKENNFRTVRVMLWKAEYAQTVDQLRTAFVVGYVFSTQLTIRMGPVALSMTKGLLHGLLLISAIRLVFPYSFPFVASLCPYKSRVSLSIRQSYRRMPLKYARAHTKLSLAICDALEDHHLRIYQHFHLEKQKGSLCWKRKRCPISMKMLLNLLFMRDCTRGSKLFDVCCPIRQCQVQKGK